MLLTAIQYTLMTLGSLVVLTLTFDVIKNLHEKYEEFKERETTNKKEEVKVEPTTVYYNFPLYVANYAVSRSAYFQLYGSDEEPVLQVPSVLEDCAKVVLRALFATTFVKIEVNNELPISCWKLVSPTDPKKCFTAFAQK
jgi:hypothetical protein